MESWQGEKKSVINNNNQKTDYEFDIYYSNHHGKPLWRESRRKSKTGKAKNRVYEWHPRKTACSRTETLKGLSRFPPTIELRRRLFKTVLNSQYFWLTHYMLLLMYKIIKIAKVIQIRLLIIIIKSFKYVQVRTHQNRSKKRQLKSGWEKPN